jgi:hypothetical protein
MPTQSDHSATHSLLTTRLKTDSTCLKVLVLQKEMHSIKSLPFEIVKSQMYSTVYVSNAFRKTSKESREQYHFKVALSQNLNYGRASSFF